MIRGYISTIAIILVTCLPSGIAAQENSNASAAFYGIQSRSWSCDASLKTFEGVSEINLSFLYGTFGTSFDCLNRFVADPRTKEIEIHLVNEVCARNNRCGSYEFLSGIAPAVYNQQWETNDEGLRRRFNGYSRDIGNWVSKLPDRVSCSISGGLESNLSQKAGRNLVGALKELFPRCRIVWNPMRGQPIEGTIFELHGSRPGLGQPCISNLDGEDVNFPERHSSSAQKINASEIPAYLARYQKCELANIWISEFNGLCQTSSWQDPRQRTCFPSPSIFSLVRKLFRASPAPVGPPPPWDDKAKLSEKGCKSFERPEDGYKKDFVWKESDTKKNQNGDLVALVLFPRKFNKRFSNVQVLSNGKTIETFSFVYNYTEDGSNRQVWKGNKAPKDYPFNSLLKADNVCFRLRNPKQRID